MTIIGTPIAGPDFKNIHDGHTGFVPFTALLRKDESGRLWKSNCEISH